MDDIGSVGLFHTQIKRRIWPLRMARTVADESEVGWINHLTNS
jgi:hypothetical protein